MCIIIQEVKLNALHIKGSVIYKHYKFYLPDRRRSAQSAFTISVIFNWINGVDVLVGTRLLDQLVAFLMDQELALDALEALPAQAPDTVLAEGTEGALELKKRS